MKREERVAGFDFERLPQVIGGIRGLDQLL